jgi:hypothetical protein
VLSRLRGAECRNVVLVCDAGMVGLALADGTSPPKSAGTNYLLAKARVEGVFHPKVIVQIGKNRGRLSSRILPMMTEPSPPALTAI